MTTVKQAALAVLEEEVRLAWKNVTETKKRLRNAQKWQHLDMELPENAQVNGAFSFTLYVRMPWKHDDNDVLALEAMRCGWVPKNGQLPEPKFEGTYNEVGIHYEFRHPDGAEPTWLYVDVNAADAKAECKLIEDGIKTMTVTKYRMACPEESPIADLPTPANADHGVITVEVP